MRSAPRTPAPILAALAAASVCVLSASQDPARPNIVFVLADDLGWNDIGYHGSEIRTPNLDRLAAEGAKLDRHYVYPTCSPTRVGLLSGRFPSRFGVLAPLGATTKMQGNDARLPQELRRLGYRTHISGKWHIGETPEHRPLGYGFDTTYGYLRGQIDPYTHRYKFGDHVTWHRNDEFVEEAGHVTDLITDEAVRVVRESGDEPFFLYVAHHSPHSPLNEPPKWIAPYEETFEDIWRRHFAAAVTHMDEEIGRIAAAIEEAGKTASTLFVFSSDNGGQRSWDAPPQNYNGRYAPHTTLGNNLPLRGWKGDLYEGGIRVPAFVRWPGVVEAGTVVEAPVHIADWTATFLSVAGGSTEESWKLDGRDVGPLLFPGRNGDGALEGRTLYWRTPSGAAIQEKGWKLILTKKEDRAELFDLASDPYETTDLAASEPERLAKMKAKLREIQEEDDVSEKAR